MGKTAVYRWKSGRWVKTSSKKVHYKTDKAAAVGGWQPRDTTWHSEDNTPTRQTVVVVPWVIDRIAAETRPGATGRWTVRTSPPGQSATPKRASAPLLAALSRPGRRTAIVPRRTASPSDDCPGGA